MGSHSQTKWRWDNREVQGTSSGKRLYPKRGNRLWRDLLSNCKICLDSFDLAIVASLDLELQKMDVKIIFLNGGLKEEIYMQQPNEFVEKS